MTITYREDGPPLRTKRRLSLGGDQFSETYGMDQHIRVSTLERLPVRDGYFLKIENVERDEL